MSVKQGGISTILKVFWYDAIWGWTQVSQTIGEHSIHEGNNIQGSLNKFPDFFRIGTFIDSTHMKLKSPSK